MFAKAEDGEHGVLGIVTSDFDENGKRRDFNIEEIQRDKIGTKEFGTIWCVEIKQKGKEQRTQKMTSLRQSSIIREAAEAVLMKGSKETDDNE